MENRGDKWMNMLGRVLASIISICGAAVFIAATIRFVTWILLG